MKVAVIGAQGVGKTTLARALERERRDVHYVAEAVRNCPYPVDETGDFRTEWWILSHQILAEQTASLGSANFLITDRSVIDTAVYTDLIHKRNPHAITLAQRNLIFETVANWLCVAPYHKIFHVRVDPLIWQHRDINDGYRSTSAEWYQLIDAGFSSVLHELEIKRNAQYINFDNNGRPEVSIHRFLLEFELDAMKLQLRQPSSVRPAPTKT